MAIATFCNLSTRSLSFNDYSLSHNAVNFLTPRRLTLSSSQFSAPSVTSSFSPNRFRSTIVFFSGNGGGIGSSGGGGDGGKGDGDDDANADRNRTDAFLAMADERRTLDTLPKDLAAAVQAGKVPGSVIKKLFELEKSAVLRWLLQFDGFRERLLADDLFLTKVAFECGVGIFTKTAAEYEKRKDKFMKELDFVIADVVMAIIADFMLVWLPAPTISFRPPLAVGAGPITKFFYSCPDNAFQVALAGTSYSLPQRIGAIVRNGAKLFAVGTSASLDTGALRIPSLLKLGALGASHVFRIAVGVTNALINARKAVDKSYAAEAEDVPIISTSVAYGVYMAVSSNLRYQLLAGVVEQRLLEPLLHQQKAVLSAASFAVRTGNTFLGSLMWVDYARWIGIQ